MYLWNLAWICSLLIVTNGYGKGMSQLAPAIASSASQEKNNRAALYETLTITSEDKKIIGKLLMTMAENNPVKLLFEKKQLETWGDQISHVHPIRFLGTVFTDPRLVYCMREIRKSSFKWSGFVDGFAERMQEEADHDNLVRYLPGFAIVVEKEPEELYSYFEKPDFEGLVKHLLIE